MNKNGKISIKINGKTFKTDKQKTVLEVAKDNGIKIPSLCFHPDVKSKNHCRICVIEIKGKSELKKACSLMVKDGMDITTESEKISKARKNNLKKILKKHLLECDDCVWFQNCKLLELKEELEVETLIYKDERDKVFQVGTIVFDQTKCIGCGNCVNVCPTQFLNLNKRKKLKLFSGKERDCINCGQCILHCPVGAIEGVGEFESLNKIFKDKNKVMVVQFAPAIRSSIGEEFGIGSGEIVTKKLISGLKQIGFDYVFDTATGADFTTMEESEELIERITRNEKLPAMTSCCPAWIKFLEFYYPEFISNLCTVRSPQVMLGGIIKNYWSKEKNINPKNIFVVSIMPCVAKKYEIKREELKMKNGNYPVDMVLTTRELARLFKSKRINLKNIGNQKVDSLLGDPSGAGVIYGSSGGVIESALRTAHFKATGKEIHYNDIKEVRGMDGIKRKKVTISNRLIKICVISGMKNAKKEMEKIKKDPKLYDAIEVMACPGGCVGGGGQPLPSSKKIIEKRGKGLYVIDKKKALRRAHENLSVKKVYDNFFNGEKKRKEILHTSFSSSKKQKIIKLKDSRKTYE